MLLKSWECCYECIILNKCFVIILIAIIICFWTKIVKSRIGKIHVRVISWTLWYISENETYVSRLIICKERLRIEFQIIIIFHYFLKASNRDSNFFSFVNFKFKIVIFYLNVIKTCFKRLKMLIIRKLKLYNPKLFQ